MVVERATDVTKVADSQAETIIEQDPSVRRAPSERWRLFLERFGTYLLSLVLALVIWLVAINEDNPIITQPFPSGIPVKVLGPDEGLQITKSLDDRKVTIDVRAPQDTWDALSVDDFEASVDLNGLGPDEHEVEVKVVALNTGADVLSREPSELLVQIDPIISKELPVQVDVVDLPASGYEAQTPVIEPISVTIFGPATQVNQVASMRTAVEMGGTKSQVEYENQAVLPYDSQGNIVEQVDLKPNTAHVIVPVDERPGRKEVAVRPDLTGQPAMGYRLASVQVEPSSVVLFGSNEALEQVPGFVETVEISLEGATGDISESAELILPAGVTASEGGIVILSATITPIEGGRTVKQKPITQGLGPDMDATFALDEVEVILSGPVPLLESMEPDDMFVILDLAGLLPGTHNMRPEVVLPEGIQVESILPETVEVVIVARPVTPAPADGADPAAGDEPELTPRPTATTESSATPTGTATGTP